MRRARRKDNKFVLTPITLPRIEGMKHRKTVLIDATPGWIYRRDDADTHDSFNQSFFRSMLIPSMTYPCSFPQQSYSDFRR
jgi:hypothetical protein